MCSQNHVPAVDAAISHTLTGRCPPWVVLSSQHSPLKPDQYLVCLRNDSGTFSHMYGAAGPVPPEQAEYALRFTKLNADQLPGWISPLVKRKNWWSCLLIRRTCESGSRSASTISPIIHHYGTFDYHCCKAHCVLTVPILSGNLQACCITATNSCVPCCSDNSILCARQASLVGGKSLHCTGFPCALNILGNTRHAPARCGKEDLHFTREISPAQCNITQLQSPERKGAVWQMGTQGLKGQSQLF